MRLNRFAFVASFATATLLTSLAFADAIAPEEGECQGKAAGAACKIGTKNGTCTSATCSKLDYANWDRDATAAPPSTQYACLLCNTDGGVQVDPVDAAAADATTVGAEPNVPASTSSSSCTVAAAVGVKAAAPLALAAVVPLGLLLVGRRSRRRK